MNEIDKIRPAEKTQYPDILNIWELSVKATHYFLREEDISVFKHLIKNEFLNAVNLYVIENERGTIKGFLGTSGHKIEMLFIHPDYLGQGTGKKLLIYALRTLGVREVDVNEQNLNAVSFYKHFDFRVKGRSDQDGLGKPYPLLHLEFSSKT